MPIDFQTFQLILAAVMAAGLLLLVAPATRLAGYVKLPRLSVVLLLVPVIGLVWLGVVARAMPRLRSDRAPR